MTLLRNQAYRKGRPGTTISKATGSRPRHHPDANDPGRREERFSETSRPMRLRSSEKFERKTRCATRLLPWKALERLAAG